MEKNKDIHIAFKDLAEKIFKEHKIKINSIYFYWVGYAMNGDNFIIDTKMDTEKRS